MLRKRRQEAALWLDYEEDKLDFTVEVHLYLSHILHKEAICYIILKFGKTFSISLDHVPQLVQQVIDVKSFANLSIERVRL